ncbi:MAG: MCP four helix bundle domain-containing protein, partial [Burkholderiaceae bacterium]|nr:MCP four helix bundle domain-containing protein [Burkholderiaceae bacterium]
MKNLKIGMRLGLGFAVVLLVMIVSSLVAINRLAVVNQASTDMAENRVPKLLMAQEIQEMVNLIARASRNALLVKTSEEAHKEIARVREARKRADELYEKFDKLMVTPKGREQLKFVLEKRAPYGAGLDKVNKLIVEGNKAEATDYLMGDLRKRQEAYLSQLEAFQKYFVETMNQGNHEADEIYAMARILLLLMLGIAVLIGIVVAVTVTRSITRPLVNAVKVAETVASGDLTSRIEVRSSDETGQLLQALKHMNDSLINIVSQVRTGTDTIATASAQIAAGNQDLSSRTEEQASSLEETASSMEELTSTVRQNADNAR